MNPKPGSDVEIAMDEREAAVTSRSFLAWRRTQALPPGTPCYNCATALLGPWCHECGQAAEDCHRHAHHLIGETLESLFHADGRLWRTLWRLAVHPARLTRDYLDGKRAPQIPPLRLFLVALLILFVVGGWSGRPLVSVDARGASAADQADILTMDLSLGLPPAWDRAAAGWLRMHVDRALAHPGELAAAMQTRAHDFAFLMLPVSAFVLAAIFARRRGFVLFDHFVFSMHSLSFQAVLISVELAGQAVLGRPREACCWRRRCICSYTCAAPMAPAPPARWRGCWCCLPLPRWDSGCCWPA
jgi:hypothetical protein